MYYCVLKVLLLMFDNSYNFHNTNLVDTFYYHKNHYHIVFLSMDNMYSTIGENMRYFMYKYKFSTNDWYRPLSFLNNKIDTYVNSTVNFDIVCTATAIKELCQARDMGDTQFFNRQELTIMINTLCKQ